MTYILSLLILIPLVGAVVAWFVGTSQRLAKLIALGVSLIETTLATLLLVGFINPGWAVFFGAPTTTPPPTPGAYVPLYYMERYSGWSQFGFNYIVGVDGLSVPLIWLTTLLTTLAIVFHWDEENRPRAFFGLFLFLEMTLVGVFMSLDLLLFAVFWELVIIPMFFLIGIWGGPNRRYAALKFLIFTQTGFVIMLLSIFALYFNSAGVNAAVYGTNANTLDMTAFLHGALRHETGTLATYLTVGLQIPIFAAFLVGFLVKLPSFPFHTWLPDAHVEAPTGGSVLLAGVLLKMGGYGIFRINLGILPDATKNLWWVLAVLGTVSMVYAAFVCLAQVDLKRLIAYSSIGHMGFVLLGASSLTVIGVQGGIFQLFNHGIITAILFMLAGSVKHATGTRDIPELQGLAKVMPQFSFVLAIGFFASLGLPGLNSFWSEFMVFVGAYGSPNLGEMRRLIIIPLISIVVTAAYYVYTMQRILFGEVPEKLGHSHDLLPWERVSYVVLVALVFLVGFLPFLFLGMINTYTAGSFPWLGGL
ncbi:MAG: NADH-quinone oxidoreductase subunit M [Methanobacteriota archaeon]|nr:MAG: NADH-quinone oxidoreductase subunit M [Euryarchaeota archaeon]